MLDHSIEPKPHPSIMSIGRKWVSDTNLSKLLHETIEKKQANKQSKLPDFCKDAILSATIKKISSALLINQNLPCSETDQLETLQDQNPNNRADLNSSRDISDQPWEDYSDIAMSLDNVELEDMDSSTLIKPSCQPPSEWRVTRPPFERQAACNSPKRKRQPSYEGTEGSSNFTNLETVVPSASPRKKRRADFSKTKSSQNQSNFIIGDDDDDDDNWSEDDGDDTDSHHNTRGSGMNAQRSQSLPHLTFFSKEDLMSLPSKEGLLSPPKNSSGSVVNSISELSIHDCLGPSGHNSWCFPNDGATDSDPLELNGFFQELNTVSVNPNS